jgi:hypothetical protein
LTGTQRSRDIVDKVKEIPRTPRPVDGLQSLDGNDDQRRSSLACNRNRSQLIRSNACSIHLEHGNPHPKGRADAGEDSKALREYLDLSLGGLLGIFGAGKLELAASDELLVDEGALGFSCSSRRADLICQITDVGIGP